MRRGCRAKRGSCSGGGGEARGCSVARGVLGWGIGKTGWGGVQMGALRETWELVNSDYEDEGVRSRSSSFAESWKKIQ